MTSLSLGVVRLIAIIKCLSTIFLCYNVITGSGGLGCAKRAAGYGASVAIIEGNKYGGTCVNVGCVPKKVMYNASHVMESMEEAKNFGCDKRDPKH